MAILAASVVFIGTSQRAFEGKYSKSGDAIYITGDTVWYDGTAEICAALLAQGGDALHRGGRAKRTFRMTMGSNDALEAANAFPGAAIVAVHNEGWTHLKESAAELSASFATLGVAARLTPLERGKPTRFEL